MRNKRFCSLVMAATVTLSGFLGAYGDSLLNINSEGARQFEVTAEAATYRSSDIYNTTGGAYMKIKDTMNVEFGKVKVDMKTVELVSSSAKSYEPILCDKYFSKYISNSDYGYISRSSLLQCSTPDDAMQPQWLIYTNFVADAHILLLREYETYEKKHTIYIGDCLNEIYCKTAVK